MSKESQKGVSAPNNDALRSKPAQSVVFSILNESFAAALAAVFVLSAAYFAFEPVLSSAQTSANDSVVVSQSVTASISITDGANITMTPLSVTQNTAVGTSSWTIRTNNATGYALNIAASTSPALRNASNSFTDYTPASTNTPEVWSVGAGSYEFGFSVFGANITTGTWGTDSDCIAAADVPSTTLRWRGFAGTTAIPLSTTAGPTATTGATVNLCVATEQSAVYAPSGTYTATITGTATTNP